MATRPDINIWNIVVKEAKANGLEPSLVWAVVLTESTGDPWAVRYEKGYRYLYSPAHVRPEICSIATETVMQQCSWGLMQIMGATARELGFRGWLSELCRPENGIAYGCKYLAKQIKRFGYEKGIASYNSGSPRYLVDGKTLKNYDKYVKPILLKAAEIEEDITNET
jgi:soluble lytic murein transglycosylase-like protein